MKIVPIIPEDVAGDPVLDREALVRDRERGVAHVVGELATLARPSGLGSGSRSS